MAENHSTCRTNLLRDVSTISEVRRFVREARGEGRSVGLVPTMGALHEGHLSLIRTARMECDFVVVTIFVNPMQFAPNEDFSKYPRSVDADLEDCRDTGVDLVFRPDSAEVYRVDASTFVDVGEMASTLEGEQRPTHFRGVTTVVMKLFNIVVPDIAYFGAKDFQQQAIIRRMCRDLDSPVRVVTCPTIREPDGLAMSSRNQYLTSEQRKSTVVISKTLFAVGDALRCGELDPAEAREFMRERLEATPGLTVDYATIVDPGTLQEVIDTQPVMVAIVAARVGTTRLIDNVLIESEVRIGR